MLDRLSSERVRTSVIVQRCSREVKLTAFTIILSNLSERFPRVVIGSLDSVSLRFFKSAVSVIDFSLCDSIDRWALNTASLSSSFSRIVFESEETSDGGTSRVSSVFGRDFGKLRVDLVESCVEDLRDGGIRFFAKIVEEVLRTSSKLGQFGLCIAGRASMTDADLMEMSSTPFCRLLSGVSVVDSEETLTSNSCEIVNERVRAVTREAESSVSSHTSSSSESRVKLLFHRFTTLSILILAHSDSESSFVISDLRMLIQVLYNAKCKEGSETVTLTKVGRFPRQESNGTKRKRMEERTPKVSIPCADDSCLTCASPSDTLMTEIE